jgi:hypothetical protein
MALISIQLEFDIKLRISYDTKDTAGLIYYYSKAIAAAVDKSSGHGLGFCAESTRNPKKVNTKDGFSGLKLVFLEQLQQIKGKVVELYRIGLFVKECCWIPCL